MKNKKISWFDDAKKITNILIVLILAIILLSQNFAINNNLNTIDIFRNIINHNIVYLLLGVYFIALKTYSGKKNFNYLNLILILLYVIVTVTSLLTLIQSFNLNSIISFILNAVLLIYLAHVFLRNTRVWNDYKLKKSPFNELGNDWLFSAVVVLSVVKLAVVLLFTTSLDGAFISFLDCIFICFFGRYIYLYREYLDMKKIDANNDGDFTEIKEKINDFVEENDLDETIDSIKDKVNDFGEDLSAGVNKILESTDIDEKIVDAKDKVVKKITNKEEPPKKKKKTTTKKKVVK